MLLLPFLSGLAHNQKKKKNRFVLLVYKEIARYLLYIPIPYVWYFYCGTVFFFHPVLVYKYSDFPVPRCIPSLAPLFLSTYVGSVGEAL